MNSKLDTMSTNIKNDQPVFSIDILKNRKHPIVINPIIPPISVNHSIIYFYLLIYPTNNQSKLIQRLVP
jgi:hypothetical protein